MKTSVLFAALGASLAVPSPLLATEGHSERGSGCYEWVSQAGQHATGPGLKRAWKSAVDCRKPMQHMGARPAHQG